MGDPNGGYQYFLGGGLIVAVIIFGIMSLQREPVQTPAPLLQAQTVDDEPLDPAGCDNFGGQSEPCQVKYVGAFQAGRALLHSGHCKPNDCLKICDETFPIFPRHACWQGVSVAVNEP